MPSVGNVTVVRLVVQAASAKDATPRLAAGGGVPRGTLVLVSVSRSDTAHFAATAVVIRPSANASGAPPTAPAGPLTLRLSPGARLAEPARIAREVLYANPAPTFGLVRGGKASVLAGGNPSNLTVDRIVADAQLLTLDRSVPLPDMGLLGLPFVAARFTVTGRTVHATAVVSLLNPVSALELGFPSGTAVTRIIGPGQTEGEPKGSAARLYAKTGSFQEGIAYSFSVELSRAPRRGDVVTLRASSHYFESTLPFTERFALT